MLHESKPSAQARLTLIVFVHQSRVSGLCFRSSQIRPNDYDKAFGTSTAVQVGYHFSLQVHVIQDCPLYRFMVPGSGLS